MRSRTFAVIASSLVVLAGCGADKDERIAELEAELEEAQASAAAAHEAREAQAASCSEVEAKVATLETSVGEQAATIEQLEGDKGSLEGELAEKKEVLEQVKELQDALAKSLVEEIETGDIRVAQRGGFLVVNVSDKVLFATGKAELSERGQKVITRLSESLKGLPDATVFQVGGHTDNQPIKSDEVKAVFPTNWELSAARATNVVRFLEETCEIPGERLVAAGFSRFRPVTSNKKSKGRAKNRRIEIALLPPRE